MVVILEPDAVPALRLTVDEYLQADLPEGYRYELVDGVVTMSPNPDPFHEEMVCNLSRQIYAHWQTHPEQVALVTANGCVPVPGTERVREPDLAVYRKRLADQRGWTFWKHAVPCLVVEVVSLGQEHRDYRDKRHDYQLAGVEEYWIVDPEEGSICVLTREQAGWEEHTVAAGEEFTSRSLPGLVVRVDEVLGQR